MKKTLLLVLLIIAVVALPLLTACPKETATPTTTAPTTVAPTTTAAPAVIELKYASHMPPQAGMAKMVTEFHRELEAATGNKIKITEYWGGSLMKQEELFRGVPEGIADMGWYTMGEGGLMPLNEYTRMPLLFKSWYQSCLIVQQMWAETPELRAELEDNGMILYGKWVLPPENLHLSKQAVRVPNDVKGMKIEAASYGAEFWAACGAAPVEVGPSDWTTSLEKGLIEGMSLHWAAMFVFGLVPMTPYHVDWGLGGISTAPFGTIISTKKWNSLPDDVKKVFMDKEEDFTWRQYTTDGVEVQNGINQATELKQTFIQLTDDEIAQWQPAAKVVTDKWIAKVGATGKPAQKILDRVKELAETTAVAP